MFMRLYYFYNYIYTYIYDIEILIHCIKDPLSNKISKWIGKQASDMLSRLIQSPNY